MFKGKESCALGVGSNIFFFFSCDIVTFHIKTLPYPSEVFG